MVTKIDPEIDPNTFHDLENTGRRPATPESEPGSGKNPRKIDPAIDPNQFFEYNDAPKTGSEN